MLMLFEFSFTTSLLLLLAERLPCSCIFTQLSSKVIELGLGALQIGGEASVP